MFLGVVQEGGHVVVQVGLEAVDQVPAHPHIIEYNKHLKATDKDEIERIRIHSYKHTQPHSGLT